MNLQKATRVPMPFKMIQIGAGTWGEQWCKEFLPPNIEDGLIEVTAVVDLDANALSRAKDYLGLTQDQCFFDVKTAMERARADFCTVVVPPAFHEQVVDLALQHDLHILSEKPIADTLAGSIRIAEKVRRAGIKMAVTMSHRFDQDKTTLREELRTGKYGQLDYLVNRFTCDTRRFGAWGKFRHEMRDAILIEGAVHQLDILADLAGSDCKTLYATTWNPAWGEYKGDSQALVTMTFGNGVRAFYEGAKTNSVGLNGWYNDYIRAECSEATIILDRRKLEFFPYDRNKNWATGSHGQGQLIPLRQQKKWINTWLIERFIDWLNGGEALETDVQSNLQSVALVFSAIESSRSGLAVSVKDFLDRSAQTAFS